MTPADLLAGLARELAAIEALAARGRGAWETDELLRLALGLGAASDPWTELYDYRCLLAHALPEQLDSERVWYDTVGDVSRRRRAVERQGVGESR